MMFFAMFVTVSCAQDPCQNDGTGQSNGANGITCVCRDGYYGPRCEFQVADGNPCAPNPCQNGGQCTVTGIGTYECSCADGYSGFICDNEDGGVDIVMVVLIVFGVLVLLALLVGIIIACVRRQQSQVEVVVVDDKEPVSVISADQLSTAYYQPATVQPSYQPTYYIK